ncbi:aldo/keto reductase [Streptomyces sp. 3MP-14]|uniref:Aldo/keto reductase n=1 Tax=Streptomyces mimosae TaxID=2586635 RepID=A0A5N6AIC0_9ACTN|nr:MULTISPECIES: aldo/keto reductase [Streptomyces]KAB8167756.1 aldo/keto reductase [Streptomyces mimosae]KAB8177596.1 aldo/keto reductase [Streptomyces sp. 3MP-14]
MNAHDSDAPAAPSTTLSTPAAPAAPSAGAAGTWRLGDHTVNRLGFGAMRLPSRAALQPGLPSRDRETAIRVLRTAVDLGVNHIDTAAFYFSPLRSANELINTALAPYPDELLIVTKVGPGREPGGRWVPWARPEQLRGQVEENLRQLGRDHLDVVNLRVNGETDIVEHFGALADLRRAGLIRHLGLSNVGPELLAQAAPIAPVVCVQNRYSLAEHTAAQDEMLRLCAERGIAFVPFFAIAGEGRESGASPDQASPDQASPDRREAEITEIATAHGATPAQIRLAWTLHQGPHVLAIPGTGDPAHLAENVAAAAIRLTPDELARLAAPATP